MSVHITRRRFHEIVIMESHKVTALSVIFGRLDVLLYKAHNVNHLVLMFRILGE